MTGYMDEVGYVDMKEYWYHANRLRKRIDRKIHEIHMIIKHITTKIMITIPK